MITCHVTIFSIGPCGELILTYSLYFNPIHYCYGLNITFGGKKRTCVVPRIENGDRVTSAGDRRNENEYFKQAMHADNPCVLVVGRYLWRAYRIGCVRAVWRPRLICVLATSRCLRGPLGHGDRAITLQTAALQAAVSGESVDLVGNNQ
jgi:hypothetical protein